MFNKIKNIAILACMTLTIVYLCLKTTPPVATIDIDKQITGAKSTILRGFTR